MSIGLSVTPGPKGPRTVSTIAVSTIAGRTIETRSA
jgi:hypothetical protein